MSITVVGSLQNKQPRNVVNVDEDYEVENLNAVVIANAPDPVVNLNIKLPSNPLPGLPITLVGAGTSINVDGNGNTITNGQTFVLNGSSTTYRFAQVDPCDPCETGLWVAECCLQPTNPTS